jgi:protease-4
MRDFFKTVLATLVGLILFGILGITGLTLLLASASLQVKETAELEDKTILVYDLSLVVTDRPLPEGLSISLDLNSSANVISLRSLLNAIRAAATDDKITGLYLLGGQASPGAGYGTLQEIREALKVFHESGKPILAYNTDWGERDYYLASVANSIMIDPLGTLSLDGFAIEQQFYAGALQKYGIGMQVVRVGKYKSAVEPFIEKSFSPASRQQTQQLLGDLWQDWLTGISADRKLKIEQLQAVVNQSGILMPEEAKAKGLIDQVVYSDEVEDQLQSLAEVSDVDESYPNISLTAYARHVDSETSQTSSENEIAIVYAEGEIVGGGGDIGTVGSDEYVDILQDLRNNEDVKAVVLRINSPGGGSTAAALIKREVDLLQAEKPVIVSMGDEAASGGYWIAASAQQIFADPGTITGSIGVFGLLPNFEKIANQNGITWDSVTTGPYANIDTFSRPKTKAELAIYQKFTDDIYRRFVATVAEGRKLPEAKVNELAQGRVWSGTSAQQVKLVDQLGGLTEALAAAAEAAELGDDWVVKEYPTSPSFEEEIFERIFGDAGLQSFWSQEQTNPPLPSPLADLMKVMHEDWQILLRMDDPHNVYTRLPYQLDIR